MTAVKTFYPTSRESRLIPASTVTSATTATVNVVYDAPLLLKLVQTIHQKLCHICANKAAFCERIVKSICYSISKTKVSRVAPYTRENRSKHRQEDDENGAIYANANYAGAENKQRCDYHIHTKLYIVARVCICRCRFFVFELHTNTGCS